MAWSHAIYAELAEVMNQPHAIIRQKLVSLRADTADGADLVDRAASYASVLGAHTRAVCMRLVGLDHGEVL